MNANSLLPASHLTAGKTGQVLRGGQSSFDKKREVKALDGLHPRSVLRSILKRWGRKVNSAEAKRMCAGGGGIKPCLIVLEAERTSPIIDVQTHPGPCTGTQTAGISLPHCLAVCILLSHLHSFWMSTHKKKKNLENSILSIEKLKARVTHFLQRVTPTPAEPHLLTVPSL